MQVEHFVDIIHADYFVGVPDSQLKPLCNYLMKRYGIDGQHHVIAANEGNCVAIATGHYLATGKVPVVYMQNSGEGNIINPVASLLNEKVYAIPMIFVIGWRGEPGVADEPQHIFQGEVTLKLLHDMGIGTFVIDKDTTENELQRKIDEAEGVFAKGKSLALIIKKNALFYEEKISYENDYCMKREDVISQIVKVSGKDPIVSTTGKASRELFEIRERLDMGHQFDFLTVGSMGHSSSIALGIASQKEDTKVWCIDGDGALLMHMGALAVIGSLKPNNLIHIIINNCAHETVGGMPTVARDIDIVSIAKACGYPYAVCVNSMEMLELELERVKNSNTLSMIEVKCGIGARDDLGRPTTKPIDNKKQFMKCLKEK